MQIPLPQLLRHHRFKEYQTKQSPFYMRLALKLWAFLAQHPRLYHAITAQKIRLLGRLGYRRGAFRYLPFASGWTTARDMPAPQGETFMALWKKQPTQS